MKVLERAKMPDGVEILLEDWSDHNNNDDPEVYGMEIGAYPIAKRSGPNGFVKEGKIFRLAIKENRSLNYSRDNIRTDFEALKKGNKKLEDLSEYFFNREKAEWYLGMTESMTLSD